MQMKWRVLTAVAVLASIYSLSTCSSRGRTREADIGTVQPRLVRTTVLASGEIAFVNSVDLRPEITGVVSQIAVRTGQNVHKGDVLLTFDPSTLQAELRQQSANIAAQKASLARSRAAREHAQRQRERSAAVYARKVISRDSFDQTETAAELAEFDALVAEQNLALAEAQRDRTEEILNKSVIRAPFDGQVIDIAIKQGETAVAGITNVAGSQLLTLADTSGVVAEIAVDEMDVGKVRLDQAVEIDVVAFPGKRLRGRVVELDLSAQSRQNSEGLKYRAVARIDDTQELPLRKRMTVRAEVVVSSGESDVAVPLRAILTDAAASGEEKHSYVYAVVGGRARKKPVQLGRSDDEYQVIRSGLAPDDKLVLGPYQVLRQLQDGDGVIARPAAAQEGG